MVKARSHQLDDTAAGMLYSNSIVNGGCKVAQRGAVTLTTTSTYGQVDRFRCHGTGTAVSAGTMTQDSAASVGSTGYALKVSSTTITGTGVVLVRYRMEAKDALAFKSAIASFAVKVRHDVGSTINYTITVRKANSADNFSAVTDIQASAALPVVTATSTTLALEGVSMGDPSNGIEIEISAACGAITTKNFWYTEFQFNPGYRALAFMPRAVQEDLANCQRYYETGRFFFVAYSVSTNIGSTAFFKTTKRSASPVVVQTNVSTAGGASATPGQADVWDGGFLSFRGSTLTGSAQFNESWTAEAEL